MSRDISLEDFSQRGLNLLSAVFGGDDARVVLSSRAKHPATVVLDSRTVVLDPKRTGLYDLALCARILKRRGLRRTEDDRQLTRLARTELIPHAQAELLREFPGIGRLFGRYRPNKNLKGFRVVNRSVEWRPLPEIPPAPKAFSTGDPTSSVRRQGDGPWISPDLEFAQIPELEITGAGDDFAWMLDAISQGHIPLQAILELRELPFLRAPFRISTSETCPLLEPIEELVANPESKEIINGLIDCYRRKSEVRQERSNLGRHRRQGVRLDSNRLVDAVVARRCRTTPRIFRQRGSTIEPVFDPFQHLVVIAFDINDLQRGEDWREVDLREATQRFLACVITVYQRLEVDCVVIGFADRLIQLPDGSHFCLHLSSTIKGIDEAVDDAFWNRVGFLLGRPLQLPGLPTCFHPLSMQDVMRQFESAAREDDHSYRAILWWARRGMHRDFPQFRTSDFLMRTADHVDAQIQEAERRYDGTRWDRSFRTS